MKKKTKYGRFLGMAVCSLVIGMLVGELGKAINSQAWHYVVWLLFITQIWMINFMWLRNGRIE